VETLHRPHAVLGVLAAAVALHHDALAGPERHEIRAVLEAPLRALRARDRPAEQLLDLLLRHGADPSYMTSVIVSACAR
jgi:hypothetical protein